MIIYSLILSTKLFRNSPETDVNTDPNYANFVSTEHSWLKLLSHFVLIKL